MAAVKSFLHFFLIVNGLCIGTFFNVVAELHSIDEILSNDVPSTYSNYNPDVDLTTPEIVKRAGYPAEAHVVQTEDGYLLTLHRIPGGPGSTPVLLQHGLLGSSSDWVITGKGKSLAFILADQGYDVWLGNARGNTYSRSHTTLSHSDSKFWDFSWHEIGIYDLPAVILYITNYRQIDSLLYIGHSMGTTSFYVMASQRPDIASKIRAMFSLSAVAFMKHVQSPIKIFAPFAYDIELLAHLLGVDEFLPQNALLKFLAKYFCDTTTAGEKICANTLFILCGFDKAEFNYTLMPVVLSHTPAGASTKTLIHYAQEIASGNFCPYDYGSKKNMEVYNSTTPPNYNLSAINVPVALYYADNDWLANPTDVERLYEELPIKLDYYKVDWPKFNHLDFLWAIDVPKLIYDRVLTLMKVQENPKNTSNTLQISPESNASD